MKFLSIVGGAVDKNQIMTRPVSQRWRGKCGSERVCGRTG